ncbi:MAG: aminotransferase class V-fold PLP-dependent enzyme [Chloroflexia bacterium]
MKAEEIDCTDTATEPNPQSATPSFVLRNPQLSGRDLRDLIVGGHTLVPLLDGTLVPYINLDNAASTPLARPVKAKVDESLEWYSAVHRGAGFKSQVSSLAYEHARDIILDFVGAGRDRTCIFLRNATEAINRCANRLTFRKGDVVLTTLMEHHSNILAWRKCTSNVQYIEIDETGAPVISDLRAKLEANKGHVRLVAVSGGSNVTGVVPDIHEIARIVHEAGALILVDAAQLAPHRPIDMGTLGAPDSIDFLAMSAHKMYAPLGSGVLIGPTEAFTGGTPDLVGGGTVLFVSEESVMWTEPPDSEEAGSPNVPGAIAMAAAVRFLEDDLGWDWLIQHERDLTSYALAQLCEIPGLTIYGPNDPTLQHDRLGVIAFTLSNVNHYLTAAILSHEYAIGTRVGCFCAHPYLMHLFHVSQDQIHQLSEEIGQGDRRNIPGAVRISFGFYNTREDVDAVVAAIGRISEGHWQGEYTQNIKTGEFLPTAGKSSPEGWFSL